MSHPDQVTKKEMRNTFNFKWKMLGFSLKGLALAFFPFMGNLNALRARMDDLNEHPEKLFFSDEERERMGWS